MRIRAVDLVDVFVYLVVLGLFTQFLPSVITESFIVSLLTAVLFKLALEVVAVLKTRILDRVRAARTRRVLLGHAAHHRAHARARRHPLARRPLPSARRLGVTTA